MAELLDNLEQVMEREQLHLDPDLSLPKLAEHLNATVNYVSQAINAGLQSTFFDYVNRKRVDEALALIQSDAGPHSAMLDIALAVGFNSTSTFYSAFRKVTGVTPGAYRRRVTRQA
jgi:AraC-like DNA-binding protein